jgi:hypothetical protein
MLKEMFLCKGKAAPVPMHLTVEAQPIKGKGKAVPVLLLTDHHVLKAY